MELEIVIQQSTHDKNALLAAPGEARVAALPVTPAGTGLNGRTCT